MKFFIDTANLEAIREVKAMGMCDGVTTNPSLMAKEGRTDTDALLQEICEVVQGPVSGEVTALDAEGMVAEGKRLAKLSEHMVVKVPTTYEGLKAIACLRNVVAGAFQGLTEHGADDRVVVDDQHARRDVENDGTLGR